MFYLVNNHNIKCIFVKDFNCNTIENKQFIFVYYGVLNLNIKYYKYIGRRQKMVVHLSVIITCQSIRVD